MEYIYDIVEEIKKWLFVKGNKKVVVIHIIVIALIIIGFIKLPKIEWDKVWDKVLDFLFNTQEGRVVLFIIFFIIFILIFNSPHNRNRKRPVKLF